MPRKSYKSESDSTLPITPPDHLGNIAKRMWRKLVPVLNETKQISAEDKTLVEMYVSQYEIYRVAYQDINNNGQVAKIYKTVVNPVTGDVIATDMVGYKRNPSTQIYSDAISKLKQIGSELGLSPASRAELLSLDLEKDVDTSGQAMKALQHILSGGDQD